MSLLRLSPIMPFAPMSYVLGLSSVSMPDYLLGTLAAMPALLGFAAIGSMADSGLAAYQTGSGPLFWALLAAGVASIIGLALRVGSIARDLSWRSGLDVGSLPEGRRS